MDPLLILMGVLIQFQIMYRNLSLSKLLLDPNHENVYFFFSNLSLRGKEAYEQATAVKEQTEDGRRKVLDQRSNWA